ncbi:MAG: hypothetical protein MJZ37_01845 [Bacilli bacterium]|nr:hypothetical protein [Bacilli bacterium]
MSDIKNQISSEAVSYNETKRINEYERYSEVTPVGENYFASEDNRAAEEKRQSAQLNRAKLMKILTGSFVTAGAAAAFGVTTLINVSMSAEFGEASYQDGHITYAINVKDMSDKESLFLHFKDGNKEIEVIDLSEQALNSEDGVISGEIVFTTDMLDSVNSRINDKNTHVTFNLTLTGKVGLSVERTFDNYAVQFYHAESEFKEIQGECHCGIDGYYYFNLVYYDDYGVFRNFTAYIEDDKGNVSNCVELDDTNAHDQHRISVVDMKSSKCKLVVSYSVEGETEARKVVTDINL